MWSENAITWVQAPANQTHLSSDVAVVEKVFGHGFVFLRVHLLYLFLSHPIVNSLRRKMGAWLSAIH